MTDRIIFESPVLRAEMIPQQVCCIQWITNDRGYLQKSLVKDFFKVEELIRKNGIKGWVMASELANKAMHAIIQKVGGVPVKRDDAYIYFVKEFPCAVQRT